MSLTRWFLALLVPVLVSLAGESWAQDTQQYVVIYLEFQPNDASRGNQLVNSLAFNSLKSPGVINFSAARQIDRANRFALIERWDSAKTYQAYKTSSTWTTFITSIEPLLAAPVDERPGNLLASAHTPDSPARATGVVVVTHLDIIPTFTDQAKPVLIDFVGESGDDRGVKVFEMISWTPTTNHFQLIEVFETLSAFNAHISAEHTIAFRTAIQAFIGAPYDERLYYFTSHSGPIEK
jgi:quinol monooxygenase YgiN